MGLLGRFVAGELVAGTPGPMDDFWYNPVGAQSVTGLNVDVESAQKVSGYFRGLNLFSNDVAKIPLELLERLSNGDKQRARGNPLYEVLHTRPNAWQTSFEWRRQGMRHLINRGNWYNRILPGPRGPVDQLVPISPDLVKPVQIAGGRLTYQIRDPKTNLASTFTQDEIFHVRGASDDGIEGKSLLTWARDSIGIALATESYAGRLFSQGNLSGGTISVPGVLDDEASKRMAQSFVTSKDQWHMPKVLEQGATYAESTLTPEDSQFLTSRQFGVTEMARWFGIPPHKLFDLSRSTNNNIEHQGIEYVGDGLQPWLVLIEQAILRDLILNPARFYAEFNVEGLLRGDSAARGELYSKMFSVGAASPNDIARRENYEAVDGGDERFVPALMRPLSAPYEAPGAGPADPPPSGPSKSSTPAKAHAIIVESAARLLRKEAKAIERCAIRHASDSDAFSAAVAEFYQAHVSLVADTLQMSADEAGRYCAGQAAQIVDAESRWSDVVAMWNAAEYAVWLASVALEEAA